MKRFMTSFAAGAMVLSSLALFGVTSATAAGPAIQVTPTTGLADGTKVAITGTGFTPNTTLAIVECALGSTDTSTCDIVHYVLVTSSPTGSMTGNFFVFSGNVGTGTCNLGTTDTTCLIAVGNPSVPAEKATQQITFGAATGTTTTTTATATTTTTTTTVPVTTTTVKPAPKPRIITLVCKKGKLIKRVRGAHPRCPAGYKKR